MLELLAKVRISERKSKLVLNFHSKRKYPKAPHKEQISEQNINLEIFYKTFGHLAEKQ